ncbi:MAG TPA: hypothetical protein VK601_25660 [Kofleriaceae bacterium]|nr:hypothetical protein [Kofleriaceae bacterium]
MTTSETATPETGHILRHWNARQYLDYYYGHPAVPDDEAAMFEFVAGGLREIGARFATGLDLGCGPVLHHAAQAVRWVDRLDMADFEPSNLEEIARWVRGDPDAFDWSVFIAGARGVLDAERGTGGTLAEREAAMRERIRVLPCNLRDPLPLGRPAQYPLVTSYYCAEWVVPTTAGWHQTMHHVASLVERGGWLFLAGVHATEYCMINGQRAQCARVTGDDVRGVLGEVGFDPASVRLDVTPGLRPGESGIQGTFMAYARRA